MHSFFLNFSFLFFSISFSLFIRNVYACLHPFFSIEAVLFAYRLHFTFATFLCFTMFFIILAGIVRDLELKFLGLNKALSFSRRFYLFFVTLQINACKKYIIGTYNPSLILCLLKVNLPLFLSALPTL